MTVPRPYDAACEHFETLLPEADLHPFYQLGSWKATLELTEINGPHGFMRYHRIDVCALMAGSQVPGEDNVALPDRADRVT